MTRFATAYDTTVCSGYVLDKLAEGIQLALVKGDLAFSRIPNSRVFEVRAIGSASSAIPEFAHPYPFDLNGQRCLAIDVRPFGHYDRVKGEFVIRNQVEYQLLVHRAKLNDLWLDGNYGLLRDVSPAAMQFYASWISENVARRFALDMREQLDLAIAAALYYGSLYNEEGEITEDRRMKLVQAVSRATRASAQDVLGVLDRIGNPGGGIESFCAQAKEATKSVRLQEFNQGVLISVLKGTWFGYHSQELLAVATEHPPTWLAVLLAAHVDRTWKNSALAKLVERQAKRDSGQQFVRAVTNLTQMATA
jgi:hypothetical protein